MPLLAHTAHPAGPSCYPPFEQLEPVVHIFFLAARLSSTVRMETMVWDLLHQNFSQFPLWL